MPHASLRGSMHRKMPHEDPNTGHAVVMDVRDAQQLVYAELLTKQLALFVV